MARWCCLEPTSKKCFWFAGKVKGGIKRRLDLDTVVTGGVEWSQKLGIKRVEIVNVSSKVSQEDRQGQGPLLTNTLNAIRCYPGIGKIGYWSKAFFTSDTCDSLVVNGFHFVLTPPLPTDLLHQVLLLRAATPASPSSEWGTHIVTGCCRWCVITNEECVTHRHKHTNTNTH